MYSKNFLIGMSLFISLCIIFADDVYSEAFDKDKLVGNVYGTVFENKTQKRLENVEVFLIEKPLQPLIETDSSSPFIDSNKGRFVLPNISSANLKTRTNSEGQFLINNIPTPFPYKKYTIIAKGSGCAMGIIDQVSVLPGASMSLRVEFALIKEQNKNTAVVYDANDRDAPFSFGRKTEESLQARSSADVIYATREGLVGHTTANGHIIQPHDHFVALPSPRVLCSLDGHEFEAELSYKEKTTREPVWDVGPWNIHDNYWDPEPSREIYTALQQYWQTHDSPKAPLPPEWDPAIFPVPPPITPIGQGVPESQKAYETSATYTPNSYNYGCDEFGRHRWCDPTFLNPAGIDLADGTFWDDLGMVDNNWISVKFLWMEPPPPLVDWPFCQRDLENSGNNPDALGIMHPKINPDLTIPGAYGYAQPVVEDEVVYLAGLDGVVYRADMRSLQCLAPFDTGAEEIRVTPALANNKLYVLDSNNVFWVLNKKTGQVLGSLPLGLAYYWQTSLKVWKNYICFTVGPYIVRVRDDIPNPTVQAIDSRKFIKTKAKSEEMYDFLATGAIKDGVFYCMDCACAVLAFDIESPNFDLLWYWLDFPIPQNIGNLKYLGNPKAIVLADDILILKNNWRFDFNNPYAQEGETGFVYALDINAHNKILWAKEIGLGSAPSVFKDNAIYPFGLFARPGVPGAIDGIVYCLNPATGDLLTPNAIGINDDVELSIGADVMYIAGWNSMKIFGVIFEPFEKLWEQQLTANPFSAVVPAGDKAYVSMINFCPAGQRKLTLKPAKPIIVQATQDIIITSFSESPPAYQKGDVSMDGQITAHDAQLIMKHVVGQITLTPGQQELADVSGNGQISAYDAGLVMQMMTGMKKAAAQKQQKSKIK